MNQNENPGSYGGFLVDSSISGPWPGMYLAIGSNKTQITEYEILNSAFIYTSTGPPGHSGRRSRLDLSECRFPRVQLIFQSKISVCLRDFSPLYRKN